MDLSERKMQILKSIIDAYIDTGEPVGSKYLTQYGHISLSPATIRNEMSDLEEMGFLDKPHTSAGRIPSNRAYRLYIDRLMEGYRLGARELSLLNQAMHYQVTELNKLVAQAAKVMSDITNYAALSITEGQNLAVIDRFDALLIDSSSFLLVMITKRGIKSKHVRTDFLLDTGVVRQIKDTLNRNFSSIPLDNIALPVIMRAEEELGAYRALLTPILHVVYESVSESENATVKIDGLTNLLSYPEFCDVEKMRDLLSLFDEHRDRIQTLFAPFVKNEDVGVQDLKVFFGEESSVAELADSSLVLCTLPLPDATCVVGVLGPRRMDYKKVFSSLRQFADNIRALTEPKDKAAEHGSEN